MILLVGPAYQGKLRWICREFSVSNEEIFFCRQEDSFCDWTKPVISGLHLYCKAALASGRSPVREMAAQMETLKGKILLCDEIGSGIVPLTAEDRQWREAVGQLLQLLAKEAETVISFLCGIPLVLKGTIPLNRKVLLLRHGLSEAGKQKKYSGWSNTPLCEEGRLLLQKLSYPKANAYYSSPSIRATETLQILFGSASYSTLPGLQEASFGDFEGCTYEELKGRTDYQRWISDTSGEIAPPGGESRNQHRGRVVAAFDNILRDSFQTAAVVCHGGSIVQIMEHFFPGQKDFYEWQPECGRGWLLHLIDRYPVSYQAL